MEAKELNLISEKNRLRLIGIIYKSGAGHTGGDLSCLNLLTVLYHHVMNINKDNLKDPDRDRFILSKGHCVESFFVTLESKGILPTEVLDTYGQFNSPLAGHPTNNVPGIEVNTGALGHERLRPRAMEGFRRGRGSLERRGSSNAYQGKCTSSKSV